MHEERGVRSVALLVDVGTAENRNAALGLYRAEGFKLVDRLSSYVRRSAEDC